MSGAPRSPRGRCVRHSPAPPRRRSGRAAAAAAALAGGLALARGVAAQPPAPAGPDTVVPAAGAPAAGAPAAGAPSPAAPADARPCPPPMPDGTRVRVRTAGARARHTGVALGWGTPRPRVVTARGDTVALAPGDERSISRGRAHRAGPGAAIGFLAGSLTNVPCIGQSRCGENNLFPALGMALGALVGRLVTHEVWVRVPDDGACAAGPS